MSTTCVACDEGRHGDCDGTARYIDQDGHSAYVCECGHRREELARQRTAAAESNVRKYIRQQGLQHTHVLVTSSEIEALRAKNEWLRTGYAEAIEDIESWGAYASDYFKEKWGLADDLAKHREIMRAVES